MELGKLPIDVLNSLVISKIKNKRKEVMVRPGVGEDCAVVDFGQYACVLSSDPITGATKDVGRLAVHVCCNDIASSGVEPIGIMLTIMAPPKTTEQELKQVMEDAEEACSELNVDIIGGHTEITTAVNRIIVSATALGRVEKERVVNTSGAKKGDAVIVTKGIGLEGTAIIAADKEDILEKALGAETIEKAKSYIKDISVVKEGILCGRFGVSSMHDVTEGGLLGGLWEMCEAADTGVEIYQHKIPLSKETLDICNYYKIDPLRLISSGSMIITVEQKRSQELIELLTKEGIAAYNIGKITSEHKYLIDGDKKIEIDPPLGDELYKVVE
jgi:hydrogenase expression/formation protein HypE